MAFTLSQKQLDMFKPNVLTNYISELWEHCGAYYPHLNGFMGETRLKQVLRDSVHKAAQSGFTQRGSVRFYVDMLIMFGWGFETDIQYPWIKEHLAGNKHLSEIANADSLYFKANNYLKEIAGVGGVDEHRMATLLRTFTLDQYTNQGIDFNHELLSLCYAICPQKLFVFGLESSKDMLIAQHHQTASTFRNQSGRWYLLMSLLKFLYGHQITNDPFLPFYRDTKTSNQSRADTYSLETDTIEQTRMESHIQQWGALKVYYTYHQGETDA